MWAGLRAVINAEVTAVVQRMGINSTGSEFQPIAFQLNDNGAGFVSVYSMWYKCLTNHVTILPSAAIAEVYDKEKSLESNNSYST